MMNNNTKFKVLIVDDNPKNLSVLYKILNNKYQVFAVENGDLAIKIANESIPDLIVLDILMPGINGFDVCDSLKKSGKTKDIPVIFMSALSETIDKIKGFNCGAVDYITKPYQKEEVLARIKTHLELADYRKKIESFNDVLKEKVKEKTYQLEEKIVDITDINTALRESEESYHALFSSAPDSILLTDVSTNRIIKANNASLKLFGYLEEELIGKDEKEIFVNDETDKVHDVIKTDSEEILSFRNKVIKKEGTFVEVSTNSRIIFYNNILCKQSFIRDITSQIEIENNLIEARRQSEEFSNLKSNFLANLGHELRTPLISILGYSQLMEDELENADHKKMVSGIYAGGKRLLRTLNLLIDLSMLGTKKINFHEDIIAPDAAVKDVLHQNKESIDNKGLSTFVGKIKEDLFIKVDARMYWEILNNLIGNAVKYTIKGGIEILIDSTEIDSEKWVEIIVKDTGPGIEKDKLELIFEEFRQASEGFT
ncbi:MAG: response regulator [Melioribacteraceae bacterium]|nr:response regulator [Melioribacteraceae bacterium]